MFKRIFSFIHKDFTNALRDNLIIYILIFPVLLALGLNFFLPGVQGMKLTIAVQQGLEQEVLSQLSDYGKLEFYSSRAEVKERVERPDDISGIIKDGKQYVVLLEGNESGEAASIADSLMKAILTESSGVEFEQLSLEKDNSLMLEISGALLLLSAILIGGLAIGMNIIDEKESGGLKALAVSPLNALEMILAYTIITLIIGIALALISSLILVGLSINYWQLILAIICSTGVGLSLGLIIGGLADNLIGAIAIMKVLFLIIIGIPLGSIFIPDGIRWVFYVFPNYWAFISFRNIFSTGKLWIGYGPSVLITFFFSIGLILILLPVFKKGVKLR